MQVLQENPCNLKAASACWLIVCIFGLLRSLAHLAESYVCVVNPPAVVVESCLLLSFSQSSSVAIGNCYNQRVVSCKLNKLTNKNQWKRSLRELARVALEFRTYLCESCSRIEHGWAQCISLLILCCCSYINFFHSSLSHVFRIASGAVAGLRVSLVHLSCLPKNIRGRWILRALSQHCRKFHVSIPLLLLDVGLSEGPHME